MLSSPRSSRYYEANKKEVSRIVEPWCTKTQVKEESFENSAREV